MYLILKFIIVGSGTLLSRILGFVREILMASALGTGPVADAFNAAFLLPNTFRRLFAEGAFNAAFIPLLSRKTEGNNLEEAKKFSEEVFSILFSVLLIITILMELSMPWIVHYVIAPGFADQPEKYQLTTTLAAIMFPYIIFMSLAAMMSGILNCLQRYWRAAIAPVFLNIILIVILIWSVYGKYNHADIARILGWGVLVSGLVQLIIVWADLRCTGIWIHFRRPQITQNVKDLLILAFPAALTGGITQINTLAGAAIASHIDGAISALAYADRIYQLPLGIVGVTVAIVLLPELSRALKGKEFDQGKELQDQAIEFSLFLTLPASAGLLVLTEPIIRLIYERGEFAINNSTQIVSTILSIFSLGLPAFVLIKALTPGFVARKDTFTPMIIAAISAITNIIAAVFLSSHIGVYGIAFAAVIAGWLNVGGLLFMLIRYKYWKGNLRLAKRILGMLGACGIMTAMLLYEMKWLSSGLAPSAPLYLQTGTLALLTGTGAIFYLISACSLGGINPKIILQALKNKRKHSL